jgi:hypothetical protein
MRTFPVCYYRNNLQNQISWQEPQGSEIVTYRRYEARSHTNLHLHPSKQLSVKCINKKQIIEGLNNENGECKQFRER